MDLLVSVMPPGRAACFLESGGLQTVRLSSIRFPNHVSLAASRETLKISFWHYGTKQHKRNKLIQLETVLVTYAGFAFSAFFTFVETSVSLSVAYAGESSKSLTYFLTSAARKKFLRPIASRRTGLGNSPAFSRR